MALPLIPLALAGVALTGGAVALVKMKNARDAAAVVEGYAAECDRQRVALQQAAVAGQSPAALQVIRINLAEACRKASVAGAPVDLAAIGLLPCQEQRRYIERVFTDYRATGYVDPVARDNKRNSILTAGAEMVRCLRSQVEAATDPSTLRAVLAEIIGAADESRSRAVCFFEGGEGCGRFALNEEEGNVRGSKEIISIAAPLGSPWFSGYAALGMGEAFREASGLTDRSRELREGEYGGLRKLAEDKLSTMRGISSRAATTFTPRALRGVRITLGG